MRRKKQSVYLGRTFAGRPGLFTGRVIAWAITEEQHARFSRDRQALAAYCARLRFDLAPLESTDAR